MSRNFNCQATKNNLKRIRYLIEGYLLLTFDTNYCNKKYLIIKKSSFTKLFSSVRLKCFFFTSSYSKKKLLVIFE